MQTLSRQEANRKLVAIISAIVELYPDQRFGQILYGIGVATHRESYDNPDKNMYYKDIFFEESESMLKRITATQVDVSTDSEEID